MLESGLAVISGIAVALVGVLFKKFSNDVEGVKNENKDIKENYIDRFEKVNVKLDELKVMLFELDKKIDIHISKSED